MNKQQIFGKYSKRVGDSIFTITGITKDSRESTRCFGFYFTQEEAVTAVLQNKSGMDEGGYYHYMLVEEHTAGVYGMPHQEIWFSFRKGKYRQIQVPHRYKNTTNFAIG